MSMDITVAMVALPAIHRSMGTSLHLLQWLVSAYALGFAASVVPGGRVTSKFGPHRTLLVALVSFAGSSLFCAACETPGWLIIGRAVQGMVSGFVGPAAYGLISSLFRASERATPLGILTMGIGVATALGPLIGGVLVDYGGWSAIFFFNVPICALALFLVARHRRPEPSDGARETPDLTSMLLVSGAVVLALYACMQLESWNVLGALLWGALSAACVVGFWLWSRTHASARIDADIMRRPGVAGALLARFALGLAFFGQLIYLVIALQGVAGLSAAKTGLLLIPAGAGSVATGYFAAKVTSKIGVVIPISLGLACATASLVFLATLPAVLAYQSHLFPALVLIGVAYGLISTAVSIAALGAVPAAQGGRVASLILVVSKLSAAVGVCAAVLVFGSLAEEAVQVGIEESGISAKGVEHETLARLLAHSLPGHTTGPGRSWKQSEQAILEPSFVWGFGRTMLVLALVTLVLACSCVYLIRRDAGSGLREKSPSKGG